MTSPTPASDRNEPVAKQDHVARLVKQHFSVCEGQLSIGGIRVADIAAQFGTPLYVYDQDLIEARIDRLRQALPESFRLFYSIKANPNATILRTMLARGCGLEVASAGELYQTLQAGCRPENIVFAGPGKTRDELAAALQAGIREIHVESLEEAECLNALALDSNRTATISLRINPVAASGGAMRMGGQATPFGIDEEELETTLDQMLALTGLKIVGIHLFMSTQVLDASVLVEQYQRALQIAQRVAVRLPHPLESIDFGGGLGTPYFPHERELDLEQVAAGLREIAKQMRSDPLLSSAQGILEPGRYLENEAGIYLARVTRVKHSRGKTFGVIDGGMHHHLAASGNLGQTIKRNYPVALVNKMDQPNDQPVDIVGPLCTPLDTLARKVDLPAIEMGDLFAVFQSGAYARTSSPHGFLSHNTPAEVMIANGSATLVRRRGEPQDYLSDQYEPPHASSAGDARRQ